MRRPLAKIVLAIMCTGLLGAAETRMLRVKIPVSWQLTRGITMRTSAPTLTESFRENWVLEISPNGLLNFRSPRASVPVYAGDPMEARRLVPRLIALREADLGRLVGVQPNSLNSDDEIDLPREADRLVFLYLGRNDRTGNDINLSWSDEEHYMVHVDLGTHIPL